MSNILGRLKALQFIFHGGVSFQGGVFPVFRTINYALTGKCLIIH